MRSQATDDLARYEQHLKEASDGQEALCRRCGACCGVDEKDPCVRLVAEPGGTYRCSDYEHRFGMQKTVNGHEFNCVPFRSIRFGSWIGSWKCGYKKDYRL